MTRCPMEFAFGGFLHGFSFALFEAEGVCEEA